MPASGNRYIIEINIPRKVVYDSHFYYLQWPEFGFNPILINVVRDPIERQISKEEYLLTLSTILVQKLIYNLLCL